MESSTLGGRDTQVVSPSEMEALEDEGRGAVGRLFADGRSGAGALPAPGTADPSAVSSASPPTSSFRLALIVLWFGVAGAALLSGLDYYVTPLAERPFSPKHDLYAPTGPVGHTFGVVGSLLMIVGVGSYSLRKRVRFLRRFGSMKGWLQFHIFLCTLGPFLVILHTAFKFRGLVAIGVWSMLLVVASGVFGRYVYVWIPKTLGGRFLSAGELEERLARLMETIGHIPELAAAGPADNFGSAGVEVPQSLGAAIGQSLRHGWTRRSERRRLTTLLDREGVPLSTRDEMVRLVAERSRVQQQILLLHPFQRMFRYWHAFHLPLAVVLLVVGAIHVVVVALFGYLWVL